MLNINELIAKAMKEHRKDELEVYKLIKAAFQLKEKEMGTDYQLTDMDQSKILLKMISQREDSINQYMSANRPELVDKEKFEKEVIETFLPKQPTDEDIENETRKVITVWCTTSDHPLSMKDMKNILTLVQETYPTANGKIVSKVVQSLLNSK